MRFEIDDDVLLKVSSVAVAAQGIYALAVPKSYHDLQYDKSESFSEGQTRWEGLALAANGAQGWGVSIAGGSRQAKKNTLKVHGAVWLLSAAQSAYYVGEGVCKKETGYGFAALGAILGGLCLWRGCEEENTSKTIGKVEVRAG